MRTEAISVSGWLEEGRAHGQKLKAYLSTLTVGLGVRVSGEDGEVRDVQRNQHQRRNCGARETIDRKFFDSTPMHVNVIA